MLLAACGTPVARTDAGPDVPSADGSLTDTSAADGPSTETDASEESPVVRAPSGPVQGARGRGFQAFLGIPYAEPPVGDRRWRSPVPRAPWSEVRPAITPGAACAQTALGTARGSEDCLFVNVHTPDPRPANAPVLVWIHGGAFIFGEGLQTDRGTAGDLLAQRYGLVVVSMNYRLGNFGFFTHTPSGANGNQGFEDQQLALRWVRDNIAAFGGDPTKVTLVGESAGGLSVCLHMVAPGSRGLFHRAISQSGLCDSPLPGRADAERAGAAVVRSLGCEGAADAPACLRAKPMTDVRTAGALSGDVLSALRDEDRSNWPSVDGTVLPGTFRAQVSSGMFHRVPTMLGWNRDEGTLFVALAEIGGLRVDETVHRDVMDSLARTYGIPRADLDAQYPRGRFADPGAAIAEPLGHASLACPSRRAARLLAQQTIPLWTYRFDFPDAPFQLMPERALGAFHSAEIQYVFGHPARLGQARFLGEQNTLYLTQSAYWARFARGGDPNGDGALPWPAHVTGSERSLVIDRTFSVADAADRDACALWDR
jgi:para-nitrobenzyl esterase